MKLVTDGSTEQSAVSADDQRLDRNREHFEQLFARACRYAERGGHDLAAAWAEMAADQGYHNHPGFFADDRLEQLLARIGWASTTRALSWRAGGSDWPRRVLHVLTEAYAIGGHTRLVWRWIEADRAPSLRCVDSSPGEPFATAVAGGNASDKVHGSARSTAATSCRWSRPGSCARWRRSSTW